MSTLLERPTLPRTRSETVPLLSFIVLSYNYEDFIRVTLQSILNQTVQDFEVIVVDDASSDRSREVVRGFNDPRIHLIANERNLGGAGSYNVAVQAARGEWLVNLDADDWIAPDKCVRQLKAVAKNPQLDIIGTWVNLVGSDGKPHPEASGIEPHVNGDYAFNLVDTWIGRNHLCRSSTMVRRAAHLRIGLDDTGMVAAPDYELWTRALSHGCRFGLVKERLTFMRLHPRGVTRADLLRTLLEVSFALHKNIVPLIDRRALWPSFVEFLRWVGTHAELPGLVPRERERLFGLLLNGTAISTYADFRTALSTPDPTLEALGRRALFTFAQFEFGKTQDIWVLSLAIEELNEQVRRLTEERDRFSTQSEARQQEAARLLPSSHHIANSGHSAWGATQPKSEILNGVKRWIAPGRGRWVRTKARLSRVEQRLLRFFHSW